MSTAKREAQRIRREIERTASQVSMRRLPPAVTQSRETVLRDAIWQGEMRLRTGVDSSGKRLTAGQLAAIQRAVDSARAELEAVS